MRNSSLSSSAAESRRLFLQRSGGGFGLLALTHLLQRELLAGSTTAPTTALTDSGAFLPHLKPRARNVIFLFMEGGPSHLDTFDPKPLLNTLAGQRIPPSFKKVITSMGEFHSPILGSKRAWKQHGHGGLWISDWLPQIATCADDLAVIRSCWADGINHSSGICQMNTGSILAGRPSLGDRKSVV